MKLLKRTSLPLILFVLVSILAACRPYQFKGTLYPDPEPAPDFELTSSAGGWLRLSNLKGRIVLLFFGFTTCPDVCPTTLAEGKRILEGLDEKAEYVKFLFITVDPERDTPEILNTYVTRFHPGILGLTGLAEKLAAVREDYGIVANKVLLENSSLGYTMEHTARTYLVDANGDLRLTYAYGTPYESILEDVRQLLKELPEANGK